MDKYHQVPVIKLWHVLLVPLQGDLTDEGAAHLSEEVLDRLHTEDASGLVIDITGLWMVDSHLCATLSRLAAAAALMGTRTVVSGMKPDIALTLETMGIGLNGIRTTLNLESALALLGVRAQTDEHDQGESSGTPAEGPRELSVAPAEPPTPSLLSGRESAGFESRDARDGVPLGRRQP